MTIIVFLVDTSASMNQRAYLGGRPSLLDVAKGAVETFVKFRQRSPESRGDRYMLLTFEDPPFNIKAGWKENLGTFMNELKNLQANGLTTLGAALKSAFDLLNVNRMQTGIDMYGQGRYPFYLEPAIIVAITDGGKLTLNGGIQEELNLPMNSNIHGSELTREPFRWDQRLFSLVLRLTGIPERDPMGLVPSDFSPIDTMCEVTGGRSYAITSHRMLMQCVESLVQKIQSGVVIQFEKIGPDPPPLTEVKGDGTNGEIVIDDDVKSAFAGSSWQNCRKMIYVPRSAQKGFAVGFWPIPEAFWPDINAATLPPRLAQPQVRFTCANQEPMIIENLPFDKYEVEPCPLTQFILSRKQASTCWQVFVSNSYKGTESGHPFGYLKASTNLQSVNLFVMPYNYPALLPLLDELFRIHRLRPTAEWRGQFANYLRTMPPYYAAPLRRALTRMGAPNLASTLIPESLDNSLSYTIVNNLKRLKNQAKAEFDRVCTEVGRTRPAVVEAIKVIPRSAFRKDFISNPNLLDKFSHLRDQLSEFPGFALALKEREVRPQNLRNPFDIPRSALLDQVARMRANFLQPSLAHTKLHDDDHVHSMPVSQMGNYQEYLKRIAPPLREIESAPVRQHMFGNPFKIDKRMMVDEADIDLVAGSSGQTSRGIKRPAESLSPTPQRPSKRKAGPLSRDIVLRRPYSPVPSSPASSPPSSPASPILSPSPSLSPCPSPCPSPSPSPSPCPSSSPSPSPSPIPISIPVPSPSLIPSPIPNPNPISSTISSPISSPYSSPISSPNPIASPILSPCPSPTPTSISSPPVLGELLTRPESPLPGTIAPVLSPAPALHADEDSGGPLIIVEEDDTSSSPESPSPVALVNGKVNSNSVSIAVESAAVQLHPLTPASDLPLVVPPIVADIEDTAIRITPDPIVEQSIPRLVNGDSRGEGRHGDHDVYNNTSTPLVNGIGPPERKGPPNGLTTISQAEFQEIHQHNNSVRSAAYRAIKRPGRNFKGVFDELSRLRGPVDVRKTVVMDVIDECLRFKRRVLADLVKQFMNSLGRDPQVL